MPRAAKASSTRKHSSAVALAKRSFAAPEAVEKVLPGSEPEQTLSQVAAPPPPKPLFANKLFHGAIAAGAAAHPYSRSHLKREKRKQKQHLAGGGLDSVADALAEVTGDVPEPVTVLTKGKKREHVVDAPQKRKAEPDGKIGEGSAKTVGEKSRRKQIAVNARRIPAVMSHPAFKTNPWATIREHAANTLATAEGVKDVRDRKVAQATRIEKREQVALPNGMVGIE